MSVQESQQPQAVRKPRCVSDKRLHLQQHAPGSAWLHMALTTLLLTAHQETNCIVQAPSIAPGMASSWQSHVEGTFPAWKQAPLTL